MELLKKRLEGHLLWYYRTRNRLERSRDKLRKTEVKVRNIQEEVDGLCSRNVQRKKVEKKKTNTKKKRTEVINLY